ncbi:MAG TPA: penicillin acylase family protein [Acidobacteriaceae bacterium]|nr:penicillin acylase family protein [Acidobacteriaceae bacterium]
MVRPEARARRRGPSRLARLSAALTIGGLLLAAAAVTGGDLWLKHAMRSQLPQLDGGLRLPGLSAPVWVRRDRHGVPHIQASNMDDLLEAQGFVVAQDRLWQMDMARRFSSGDLSEVLGSQALEHDKVQRVLQMRRTAERLAETMPGGQRRLFEDFARGVNASIRIQQGHLPAEFRLLRYQPRPWKPVDSWLIALNMIQRLDTFYPAKLNREKIEALLKPGLVEDLYPVKTWRDRPPSQTAPNLSSPQPRIPPRGPLERRQSRSSRKSADAPARLGTSLPSQTGDLVRLGEVLGFPGGSCEDCRPGSNEWAVSGSHTASGRPLLSNDMHLEHSIPDIWHEEDLEAGSFHAEGVTTPGIPLIIAGHNAHIAWGFTTLSGDVQDVYLEKTNAQGEYWANRQWREPEHHRELIRVRGSRDVTLDLELTVHGPVITPLLPHEHRMLALKWSLYDPSLGGLPLEDLDSASDWAEFRSAMRSWWAPTQNVVYADDQGHIGYQAVGSFPLRPAGLNPDPVLETGTDADSQREWQGWIPFEALPSVLDPEDGIVATANGRITPDGFPYPLTLNWAAPYRNERIWKWLAGKRNLTPAEMLTLQTDLYSDVDRVLAQRFAYAIDHAETADAQLREAADLLRSWDGVVGRASVAAEIVDSAKRAFWPIVLQPKLGDAWPLYVWQARDFVQEEMITNSPAEWLPAGYKNWNELLTAAVRKGMTDGGAPRQLSGWTYGSRHSIDLEHPLYGMLPFFSRWTGTGPHPLAGDETTVDQTAGHLGPSQRFTMDWSDVDGSTENIVMGESGDPVSAYYRDQWPYWYGGRTFAMPFTDPAVKAAAVHTLRLTP